MKKVLLVILSLAIIATIAWFVLHRDQDESYYRFVTVEKGTVESMVSSTGTLRATSTILVGTQVSGRIEEIYVDFNDKVTLGQLIARIDDTLLEQEVRSAKTNVRRAQAELDHANLEMQRAERLYEDKVITETEYSDATYQLALARTALEASQINLDKAERNFKYSEIRAPVDGIVLERNVEVGQTVAASLQAPQLFLIAGDLSQMEILALVDESDIGALEPGQEARFTVQAFPDRYFKGRVQQVRLQSTMQENVVNYMVAVVVNNEEGKLLPGMTATINFIVRRAEDVLTVPNAALRFRATDEMRAALRSRSEDSTSSTDSGRPGGSGAANGERPAGDRANRRYGGQAAGSESNRGVLWILDDNNQVERLRVQTGISDEQVTEIRGTGLREGMQVIAAVTSTPASATTNPFERRDDNSGGRRRPGF
jgi:HlyD family secretion protein